MSRSFTLQPRNDRDTDRSLGRRRDRHPRSSVIRGLPLLGQVLHIRNLPYETTDEELRELASPFGQLVQTKLNVGTNRNQAFIEFPDMQQAINMASYFQNSAEPAKVRATRQAADGAQPVCPASMGLTAGQAATRSID